MVSKNCRTKRGNYNIITIFIIIMWPISACSNHMYTCILSTVWCQIVDGLWGASSVSPGLCLPLAFNGNLVHCSGSGGLLPYILVRAPVHWEDVHSFPPPPFRSLGIFAHPTLTVRLSCLVYNYLRLVTLMSSVQFFSAVDDVVLS